MFPAIRRHALRNKVSTNNAKPSYVGTESSLTITNCEVGEYEEVTRELLSLV
jgi:hypothetical protein